MLKKALSLLLALLMAFNMGISAFAMELETLAPVASGEVLDEAETAEPEAVEVPELELEAATDVQPEAVAEPLADTDVVKVEHNGETTYYASLQKAFDGFAPSNNTYGGTYVVTLLGDNNGNLNKNLQYPTEVLDVTLDLNGHTITGDGTTYAVVINFGSTNSKDCKFTLKDSSGNNSGVITGGKGGVKVDGKGSFFYFEGGTITGNHGSTKGGGIFMGATAHLTMTGGVISGNSVTGTSSANTGYGGGICANYADILGGVITGNTAYKGSHLQTGRGGGIGTEITRTTGYSTLNIADGVVYGNTAENAGDDVMAQGNGNVKFSLIIGTENWYIDGWNGTKAGSGGGQTDRYNAENPVAYTEGGFTGTDGTGIKNKTLGLKYVAPAAATEYTVTYTDGVEDEEIFADQVYTVEEGTATPAFNGEPTREGYNFLAWNPAVEETVTADVTYTATWEKAITYVALLESSGEKFETLQAALDAAKAALAGDLDADKITLLSNTVENVKLAWSRSNGDMTLTIDLAGYEVDGNEAGSVMTFSGLTSYNGKFHIVIEDSSEGKTGTLTRGKATSGGAIKLDGAKGGDSLTINGGNFISNEATSSGGAIYCAVVDADIIINDGNFTNNTAKSGGAISAYSLEINDCDIQYNFATGDGTFSGRGGGIQLWGSVALDFKMNGGVIKNNSATRYGDDIVFCSTNKNTASMSLIPASEMKLEKVNAWCIDGYFGSFTNEALLGDRYSEENAVEFTDYADFSGKEAMGIAVALKAGYVTPKYTVTYTDGVEGEEVFADQVYTEKEGTATPAFEGEPTREGYTFEGWDPEVAATVTKDVTYTAQWKEIAYVARLESTGEKFTTLQDALDAAKALMVDTANEAQTVTLLNNTAENVTMNFVTGIYTANNFLITIDLAGYTVSAPEGSTKPIMTFGRTGSGGTSYKMVVTINDSSAEKTGTVTGATAGAIKMDGTKFKSNDELVINGGNFVDNATASNGGVVYAISTSLDIVINGGKFTGNTAKSGGVISAYNVVVNGGELTGNSAVGEGTGAGRGGALNVWGTTTHLTVTGGQIYGNTASRYGDDIVYGSTSTAATSSPAMNLISADAMGVEGVGMWVVDGYSGLVSSEAGITDRYSAEKVVEFTDYADFSGKEARGNAVALKAAEKPAPEAPDKYGDNVTPELIRVICDSDEDHAPLTIKWQHQSTKVRDWVSGVVWDAELNTWIVPIRIDSVSVYYVWANFENTYNDITHDMVDENQKCIDTYLKWDAEKELWVTLDEKPIDVHVTCKTTPDAPTVKRPYFSYQVKVNGYVNGEAKAYHIYLDAETVTTGEVYGSREEGFFVDVTVPFTEDDAYQAGWVAQRDPEGSVENHNYDWTKTPESVTFTLKYTGDTVGTLYGTRMGDWVHKDTGMTYGNVGEVYMIPAMPEAPEQKNVVEDLVTIICDSDSERHTPVTGKWYPQHCKTTSDITWNEELGAWTVDVRIGSLYIMYVDQLEDANNGTAHELVEDVTTVYATLIWDAEAGLWTPEEPIELHTTCRTKPLAPEYRLQLDSYQVKVWGEVDGEEKAYTTSMPEDGFVLGEVYGSREEGFYVDVTIDLENGDFYQTNWIEKKNPGKYYEYDWDRTPESITFTLRYNGDLNSTLYGNRHAANTNYDWVLDSNGKTFGVVAEAYLKQLKLTVSFNTNGGTALEPITVTYGEKYGTLPSSAITGFSGGNSNWYLVDENGNVTDTKIAKLTKVSTARDHELFLKRDVLAPSVNITLEVPGAISNDYKYYVPGNSTRILTATVSNMNNDHLDYSYQWYKDGVAIEGATEAVLTLEGNVADSGVYKVEVTATLKEGSTIIVTVATATGSKEQKVQIMRATNTLRLNENYGDTPATSDSYFGGAEATIRSAAERTGYTFIGWNTAADGTGTMYQVGATVEFPGDNGNGGIILELFAQWKANEYTVSFNSNGGEAIAPITVTYGEKYGTLPSSAITGFSGGNSNWYLVDENGNVTDTKIAKLTKVSTARDHELFLKRDVLAPTLKIALSVPGAISDDYKYYVPGNSTRILTVTVNNANAEKLDYTYQWYKDGVAIEGATEAVLTLEGNVADSGTYKVVVTATAKENCGVIVNVASASGEKEQKVQIMRAANTLRLNENYGETPATSDSYFGGAEATIRSAAERTGYTFIGWNTAADGTGTMYQSGATVEFPGDNGNGGVVLELFAQWKANEYTVTLDPNGGEVNPATVTVTYDSAIGELPVPVRYGYTFAGWTDSDGNLVDANTVYTVAGESTFVAMWTLNTYTVTFNAGSGHCWEASREVDYLDTVGELPYASHSSLVFIGWYDKDDNKVNANYVVTGDVTFYAKYVQGIVIDVDGNGTGADRTEDESNPNTGAPVAGNTVSAMAAVAVLGAVAYVLGKRK